MVCSFVINNNFGLLEIIYLFAIKNKDEKSESTSTTVATDVKTETKVETVGWGEKKEEIPTPVTEVKIEEAPVVEVKTWRNKSRRNKSGRSEGRN